MAACVFLIGCWSTRGLPEPSQEPFSGPPLTIDSSGPEHVLVAHLPNPGFRFTLDATRERFNRRDVFVTLRRPNPTVLYPQIVVDQRLSTTVKPETPITVYARLVEFDDPNSTVPHALAIESSPIPPPAH